MKVSKVLLAQFINPNRIKDFARIITWYFKLSGSDRLNINRLANRIINMINLSGSVYTVAFLKEIVLSIQFYLSGSPRCSTDNVTRVVHRDGLPKFIPGPLRKCIKDPMISRSVLTLLSVYRIMQIPNKPKLSTITDPYKGEIIVIDPVIFGLVHARVFYWAKISLNVKKLVLSHKAGPNTTSGIPAWRTYAEDAMAWAKFPDLKNKFLKFANGSGNDWIADLLISETQFYEGKEGFDPANFRLGRLCDKIEAAGKVRIFAITDSWTQTLLSQLHHSVAEVLRLLPQDGTFDQAAPLNRLEGNIRYSFDLSAATDRFPVWFQVNVLSQYIGRELAQLWADLLIDRDWDYKTSHKDLKVHEGPYRYAVGQPMGCLSSWPVFALSHHYVVQYAAFLNGKIPFSNYALLGDDIVIADEAIANTYHNLMIRLGVEINQSKSLKSSIGVCEYAKRLVGPDVEFTPLGAKNILTVLRKGGLKYIPNLFVDGSGKGNLITADFIQDRLDNLPSFLGVKPKLKELLYSVLVSPLGAFWKLSIPSQSNDWFGISWADLRNSLLSRLTSWIVKEQAQARMHLMRDLPPLVSFLESQNSPVSVKILEQISEIQLKIQEWVPAHKDEITAENILPYIHEQLVLPSELKLPSLQRSTTEEQRLSKRAQRFLEGYVDPRESYSFVFRSKDKANALRMAEFLKSLS